MDPIALPHPQKLEHSFRGLEAVVEPKTLYEYNEEVAEWFPCIEGTTFAPISEPDTRNRRSPPPSTFGLVTWNIDFMYPYIEERLATALSYLQNHTVEPLLAATPPVPVLILIQEMPLDGFEVLLTHPMVMLHYCATDIGARDWEASYGSVTLIPRVLASNVRSVFRTAFANSVMGRFALYVDLSVSSLDPGGGSAGTTSETALDSGEKTIRIANTHLESLRGAADRARVEQLTSVASFLRAPGIYSGIVAGDMNPIGPLDVDLAERLSLVDAWTFCQQQPTNCVQVDMDVNVDSTISKSELKKEGYTWGYQPRCQWPLRRMDKVLWTGNLAAQNIEILGVGLMTPEGIKDVNEPVWASDHFGLAARIDIN